MHSGKLNRLNTILAIILLFTAMMRYAPAASIIGNWTTTTTDGTAIMTIYPDGTFSEYSGSEGGTYVTGANNTITFTFNYPFHNYRLYIDAYITSSTTMNGNLYNWSPTHPYFSEWSATAVQAPTSYSVGVQANPTSGGMVSGAGNYDSGATATVTATPSSGYVFTNWTEDGSVMSSSTSYCFTATGNTTLVANFSLLPLVTLAGSNPLSIEASSSVAYSDPGATAVDSNGNAITPSIIANTVVANQPGSYIVTWSATDASGLTGTATRTIIVVAAVPPSITVPADRTTTATMAAGALVSFTTSALDVLGNAVPTINSPASGSAFPRGITPVTVTATDAAGNSSSETFTVTVTAPPIGATETIPPKIEFAGNNVQLTVQPSVPGRAYQLQFSEDLTIGSWQDVGAMYYGDGNPLLISIPANPSSLSGFYRCKLE